MTEQRKQSSGLPKMIVIYGTAILTLQSVLDISNGLLLRDMKERFPLLPNSLVSGLVSMYFGAKYITGKCKTHSILNQGLSQDLETRCPIVPCIIYGRPIFQEKPTYTRLQP